MSERVIGWDELRVGQRVRITFTKDAVETTCEGQVSEICPWSYVRGEAVILGEGFGVRILKDRNPTITLLAEPLPPEPPVGSAVMQNRGSTAAVRQTDCWRWACEGTPVDPLSSGTAWERLHSRGFRVVRHGWDGEQ